MEKIVEAEYRKLLSEIEFLSSNLEYHEAVLEIASKEFRESLKEVSREEGCYERFFPPEVEEQNLSEKDQHIVPQEDPVPEGNKPPPDTESQEEKLQQPKKTPNRKEVKELYRKIVAETHPDKLLGLSEQEKERRKRLFIEATNALEKDDLGKMQQVAIKLGLDLGSACTEKVITLRDEALKIRTKIKQIKDTFAWVWYNASNEAEKKKIVKVYINQMTK